jgi:hypothetical protein
MPTSAQTKSQAEEQARALAEAEIEEKLAAAKQ